MTNLDELSTTQDERVMAALSHIATLIPMGIIAPIVIWITQKEKSKYIAFQALQAVVFQICRIAAYFLAMGCYMVTFFGLFFTMPFASSSGSSESVSPILGLGFIIPFLVLGAILIGSLFFVIYGIIGAVMTFQGKPFRYMIVGRWVERTMQPKENVKTDQ